MHKSFAAALLLLLFMSCSEQHSSVQTPTVSSGTIERLEDFSSAFISSRNVDIWLPNDYDNTEQYSVLYMHDGQMLFDSTVTWNKQEWGVDEAISALIKDQLIEKCIVVGIWNSDHRHSDYFPQKPFELLPKGYRDSLLDSGQRNGEAPLFSTAIQSDNYLKFLVTELKPFIDKNYATRPDRNNTFVAGSSMGGLISMYAICEYPETFSGAACMSTHWPGIFSTDNNPIPDAFMNYLKRELPPSFSHKIYFDYGTETLDSLYEPYQIQVDQIMRDKGYSEKNWETRKFVGADHSESAWKKRLHIPLVFLLGKPSN